MILAATAPIGNAVWQHIRSAAPPKVLAAASPTAKMFGWLTDLSARVTRVWS